MRGIAILGALTLALVAIAMWLALVVAPVDAGMGPIQKIFYIHVPSAYAMYLGVITAAAASIVFLVRKSARADALAFAAVDVGIVFFAVVMTTGPIWAHEAWGVWWTWEPRLTTTFILGLALLVYRAIRGSLGPGDAEKRTAAVIAILSAVNVPLIHYAVRLWRGQHPMVISGGGLDPAMLPPFLAWIAAMTSLFGLLLALRYRLGRTSASRAKPA